MEDVGNPFDPDAMVTTPATPPNKPTHVHQLPTSDRPQKRRRTHSKTTIRDLPLETLSRIIAQLHTDIDHVRDLSAPQEHPTTMCQIRPLLPLRTLCRHFRDAFDAHVVSLDLCDLSSWRFGEYLTGLLPRLRNLTTIALPPCALVTVLLLQWHYFFVNSQAKVQHLIFAPPPSTQDLPSPASVGSHVPILLAKACSNSLERLSTSSSSLVAAMGQYSQHVHMLHLIMDDIVEDVLLPFRHLRNLFLLYRRVLTADRAHALVRVLKHIQHVGILVHLRMNHIRSVDFNLFPQVAGLKKLTIFDGVIDPQERGMRFLADCPLLEDIQFEHVDQLSGADIQELARLMKQRLKHLRIWDCRLVSDEALFAIAHLCPAAEVDLRFIRDQFSSRALAALGERVSYGSRAF